MLAKGNKLSLSSLLYRHSPKLLIFSVGVGAAAGALYSLIIPFVLQGINAREEGANTADVAVESAANMTQSMGLLDTLISSHSGVVFFGMVVMILLSKAASVIMFNNIAKSATAELRISIAKKINNMKIDTIEKYGFPRLQNIINGDVNNVVNASMAIPMMVVSAVTILGMLGYLAILNIYVFLIVLGGIFLGIFIFETPMGLATGLYEKSRKLQDTVQEGARGLVTGAYELKLSRTKSELFLGEEIVEPQQKAIRFEKIGDAIMHLAGTSSDLISFFIIGFLVFVLPQFMEFPASESLGVVMALLYIAAPVSALLANMQQLKIGQVAIARIHELSEYDDEEMEVVEENTFDNWQEFSLKEVDYHYSSIHAEHSFSLSPISLNFKRGQVNFIVGGNGSGKSTLSKLISLHYMPNSGGIFFDDQAITKENIIQARSKISVIFSNYYLFGKLYRNYTEDDQCMIEGYLESLGLKGKTEFIDGRFTTTKLSDGQRRRLALLVALLEDKDIYIFDEWAADQDPVFKRVFYTEILPEMKKNNKLVLVITHDDRYFECSDRIIYMEDGKLLKVRDNNLSVERSVNDEEPENLQALVV